MKAGSIAAVVVVVGYIGFELHAVSRNGYRMEPAHILGEYITAARGTELCGAPEPQTRDRFARNLTWVVKRARDALGESEPDKSGAQLDAQVGAQIQAFQRETDTLVSEKGCADIEVWKLTKRFDNLARQNLPQPQP